MKKVLILAYDFPPYVSVGGLRPYAWYRYFKEFDIYPIVVTRQWGNKYGNHLDYIAPSESTQAIIETTEYGTIIKTPYNTNLANKLMLKYGEDKYKFIRKFISAYYELLQWFFLIGSKSELYFAAKDYLRKNKVDCIIASGDPFILFRYASCLSKQNNIPWIADYRDSWVQNKHRSNNILIKTMNAFFEKKYISNSIFITTVSSFLKEQIKQNFTKKIFHIIPNGFDPEFIKKANIISQKKAKLSIAFVGTIYKWHPIELFLKVCDEFAKKNQFEIHFNFYGINKTANLKYLIDTQYQNLSECVDIYPKIENDILLLKLAQENAFILFNDYYFLGTKIFDYIALKRKILLCFSDDVEAKKLKKRHYKVKEVHSESSHLQEDLIKETNSGIVVKDSAHLYQVLSDLHKEFEINGFIACNSINTENYSRKIQVQKLAEIIKQL